MSVGSTIRKAPKPSKSTPKNAKLSAKAKIQKRGKGGKFS